MVKNSVDNDIVFSSDYKEKVSTFLLNASVDFIEDYYNKKDPAFSKISDELFRHSVLLGVDEALALKNDDVKGVNTYVDKLFASIENKFPGRLGVCLDEWKEMSGKAEEFSSLAQGDGIPVEIKYPPEKKKDLSKNGDHSM